MRVCVNMHVCACMYVMVHVCVHMCIYLIVYILCVYARVCKYACVCMHACDGACMCAYVHLSDCVYTACVYVSHNRLQTNLHKLYAMKITEVNQVISINMVATHFNSVLFVVDL